MGRVFSRAILACILVFGLFGPAEARRVALVIGNSAYHHATPLDNPRNDANALATVLNRLDFEVVKGVDLKRTEFEKTVREFARLVRGADVALLFYAGHGLQVNGRNYLAPIDAKLADEADLDFETLPLSTILKQMEREVKTSIVFLDACRDNPLAKNLARSMGTRSAGVGRGLARVDSGIGTLIAFATEPGNVALDGDGDNSPFTKALLKHIETRGVDVDIMLRSVRKDVLDETAGRQVPWSNSSLTGRFEFAARQVAVQPAPNPQKAGSSPGPGSAGRAQVEVSFWNSVRGSSDVEDFEGYLKRFPHGTFAEIAKRRLAALQKDQTGKVKLTRQAADRKSVTIPVRLGKLPNTRRNSAWLGVRIANVEGIIEECFELKGESGVFVAQVVPDSPAEKAGIAYGDIVRTIDGKPIKTIRELTGMVALEPIGATVRVDVGRVEPFSLLVDRLAERSREKEAVATYCLGALYAGGLGVAKDETKAIEFYREASDAGSVRAMHDLGAAYVNGTGVAKDPSTSAKWFRKAAELDHLPSMLRLASIYATGTGIDKDLRQQRAWLEKAVELDSGAAMSDLGWLQEHGKAGFSKDPGKAFKLYEQAANKGNNNGRYNLALLYEKGEGVGKNASEAFKWYRKGAEAGHTASMVRLGNLYVTGNGVDKNGKEAVKWYSKAIDQKATSPLYVMAWLHEFHKDVAKDPAASARYMLDALTASHADAIKEMTLRPNAWSSAFRQELQRLMQEKGTYTGPIDGSFGPGTIRAIKALAGG